MSCGISSRFQLLSPSQSQVAHVLLTRPPLTYPKASSQISPFDLHVLSAPPAFVLSQDQTLSLILYTLVPLPRKETRLPQVTKTLRVLSLLVYLSFQASFI